MRFTATSAAATATATATTTTTTSSAVGWAGFLCATERDTQTQHTQATTVGRWVGSNHAQITARCSPRESAVRPYPRGWCFGCIFYEVQCTTLSLQRVFWHRVTDPLPFDRYHLLAELHHSTHQTTQRAKRSKEESDPTNPATQLCICTAQCSRVPGVNHILSICRHTIRSRRSFAFSSAS